MLFSRTACRWEVGDKLVLGAGEKEEEVMIRGFGCLDIEPLEREHGAGTRCISVSLQQRLEKFICNWDPERPHLRPNVRFAPPADDPHPTPLLQRRRDIVQPSQHQSNKLQNNIVTAIQTYCHPDISHTRSGTDKHTRCHSNTINRQIPTCS